MSSQQQPEPERGAVEWWQVERVRREYPDAVLLVQSHANSAVYLAFAPDAERLGLRVRKLPRQEYRAAVVPAADVRSLIEKANAAGLKVGVLGGLPAGTPTGEKGASV